jgi:hypothetical protein
MEGMILGSLQVVASRLMGQRTHESKGESDLIQAYTALREYHQQQQIKWDAEAQAAMVMRRKAPVRRKAPTKPKAPKA